MCEFAPQFVAKRERERANRKDNGKREREREIGPLYSIMDDSRTKVI